MQKLLFDEFYEAMALGKHPAIASKGREAKRQRHLTLSVLDHTRIYVIDREIMQIAVEILERNPAVLYRYPPYCPMWIEFRGSDGIGELRFMPSFPAEIQRCRAIWLTPQDPGFDDYVKVDWISHHHRVSFGYIPQRQTYVPDHPGTEAQRQVAHMGTSLFSVLMYALEAQDAEIRRASRSTTRMNVGGKIYQAASFYALVSLRRP